jgi:uncharacterized protein
MKQFIHSLLFLSCFQSTILGQSNKITIGSVEELQSDILQEKRMLNIYLPDGYNPADSIKYPVIYLLDGGLDQDFMHVVGLVQFNSFEWVRQLPKSIVVGIVNVDRKRDFTPPADDELEKKRFPTSGKSGKFIQFIEAELQPFVNSRFKTSQTRTIIGESLAGLLATEILLTKPGLFNKYIIVSPALWWNNGSVLTTKPQILSDATESKIAVYIGVGKEGLAPSSQPRVMEVDANVLADKLSNASGKPPVVYFDYLPQENHDTIMHQAVSNAIKFFHQTGH